MLAQVTSEMSQPALSCFLDLCKPAAPSLTQLPFPPEEIQIWSWDTQKHQCPLMLTPFWYVPP